MGKGKRRGGGKMLKVNSSSGLSQPAYLPRVEDPSDLHEVGSSSAISNGGPADGPLYHEVSGGRDMRSPGRVT